MIDILKSIADEVKNAINNISSTDEKKRIVGMGADGTPTSGIDRVAENVVIEYISKNKIPLNVLSEEIGFVNNGFKDTLVLDPIDGTNNSIIGIPLYSISMAIGTKSLNSVHTAYLRNFVTGDEYVARKGKGSFLNGNKIHVKNIFDSKNIVMMIHLGSSADIVAHNLTKRVKTSRFIGCASLEMAYVAQGSVDGYYVSSEKNKCFLRIVDIAASSLILREAGGEVYSLDGVPLDMQFDLENKVDLLAVSSRDVYDYVIGSDGDRTFI